MKTVVPYIDLITQSSGSASRYIPSFRRTALADPGVNRPKSTRHHLADFGGTCGEVLDQPARSGSASWDIGLPGGGVVTGLIRHDPAL